MDASHLLRRYRSALMGFAQLWIVLLHCWLLIIPNRPALGAIEGFVKWNGTLGVEMFLFLSGIGMTYSIRKGTIRQFYLERLRRVLLPFWVMAAVNAIDARLGVRWMLYYATGLGSILENFQALLWFIPAILILYMLFPAYHALMMRSKSRTRFTLAMLLLWLCAVILLRETIREDLWVFINRIPAFLVGAWFGEISRERTTILRGRHWALCILVMLAGFSLRKAGLRGFFPWIPHFSFAVSWIISIPLCFLLAGLFSLLETGKAGVVFRLPLRFLGFVGTFTLALYCCHQWVFSKVYGLLEGHITYLGINLVSMAAVIAAGWLFHAAHMRFWKHILKTSAK